MSVVSYNSGDVVYDMHQLAGSVYLVHSGSLKMETCFKADSFFQIPTTVSQWEVHKVTKKIGFIVREIKRRQMFGHEEILQNLKRRTRVTCTSRSILFYMSAEKFKEIFPQDSLDTLAELMTSLQLKSIITSIQSTQRHLSAKYKAILDSTNLNDNKHLLGQVGGKPVDRRIRKIRPWLDKLTAGEKTNDLKLLDRLR